MGMGRINFNTPEVRFPTEHLQRAVQEAGAFGGLGERRLGTRFFSWLLAWKELRFFVVHWFSGIENQADDVA
jgi:hypothetical protein